MRGHVAAARRPSGSPPLTKPLARSPPSPRAQNFALVGFIFQLVHCELEKQRATHDYWNGVVAGARPLLYLPCRPAAQPPHSALRVPRRGVRRRVWHGAEQTRSAPRYAPPTTLPPLSSHSHVPPRSDAPRHGPRLCRLCAHVPGHRLRGGHIPLVQAVAEVQGAAAAGRAAEAGNALLSRRELVVVCDLRSVRG